MNTAAVASACRTLGAAVESELVTDRPSALVVYGRGLSAPEVHTLVAGMTSVCVTPRTPGEVEAVGYLLGRVVRVVLPEGRALDIGDLTGRDGSTAGT